MADQIRSGPWVSPAFGDFAAALKAAEHVLRGNPAVQVQPGGVDHFGVADVLGGKGRCSLRDQQREVLLVAQRLDSGQVHVDEVREIAELVPLAHRGQRCGQPHHAMLGGQLQ